MFRRQLIKINELASHPENPENIAKLNAIRLRYRIIGFALMILGWAGAITCFVLFGVFGMNSLGTHEIPKGLIIAFSLFLPCAILGGVGTTFLVFSKSINVEHIQSASTQQREKVCPYCGNINPPSSEYCNRCGQKL